MAVWNVCVVLMKSILEYTDYRTFLKEFIQLRHDQGLPASNRWFAQKLNINSNAWLTYVLQGKRNLNNQTTQLLSVLFKFSASESRYFKALVQFNQAKTIDERNLYYREMELARKSGSTKIVSSDQYEFYSVWYHSAIRSIIDMYPDFTDFETLGTLVSPPITASEAKKSVTLLERLGLIFKDADGKYHVGDKTISTGTYEKALAIANFQRETMKLAQEALDRVPKTERDISTMTLGISGEALEKIQVLLQETRRKIAEIASADPGSDRVFQLNMQLFPLSKGLTGIQGHK
jgi:uncharacterized protein (TIGR02147 family)